ncbi:hypothetical protein LCGC14_1853870 [marine sediment metagenome]|uniref:HNH endonuclease n=1 Tax=marine sediment metagenome TaxID=412755 RepID=A0A0F9J8R8_9ZZZZ
MESKRCNKCGKEQPLSEFHRSKIRADGHVGNCRTCVNPAQLLRHWANRESRTERSRLYYRQHKEELLARRRAHRKQHPAERKAWSKRYHEEHPQQAAAGCKVHAALANGVLCRKPCESCGDDEQIIAHHDDYLRPLAVRWLCRTCHTHLHAARREAARLAGM